jgi:hypothetical protein
VVSKSVSIASGSSVRGAWPKMNTCSGAQASSPLIPSRIDEFVSAAVSNGAKLALPRKYASP